MPESTLKSRKNLYKRRYAQRLKMIVEDASLEMVDEMKRLMALPKHGRSMGKRRGGKLRSAKGEAPAVETGKLLNSLAYRLKQRGGNLVSHIGTNANNDGYFYPVGLEMNDRQFMGPAFKHAQKGLLRDLSKLGKARKK